MTDLEKAVLAFKTAKKEKTKIYNLSDDKIFEVVDFRINQLKKKEGYCELERLYR